jgi:hypothetical protein
MGEVPAPLGTISFDDRLRDVLVFLADHPEHRRRRILAPRYRTQLLRPRRPLRQTAKAGGELAARGLTLERHIQNSLNPFVHQRFYRGTELGNETLRDGRKVVSGHRHARKYTPSG